MFYVINVLSIKFIVTVILLDIFKLNKTRQVLFTVRRRNTTKKLVVLVHLGSKYSEIPAVSHSLL